MHEPSYPPVRVVAHGGAELHAQVHVGAARWPAVLRRGGAHALVRGAPGWQHPFLVWLVDGHAPCVERGCGERGAQRGRAHLRPLPRPQLAEHALLRLHR